MQKRTIIIILSATVLLACIGGGLGIALVMRKRKDVDKPVANEITLPSTKTDTGILSVPHKEKKVQIDGESNDIRKNAQQKNNEERDENREDTSETIDEGDDIRQDSSEAIDVGDDIRQDTSDAIDEGDDIREPENEVLEDPIVEDPCFDLDVSNGDAVIKCIEKRHKDLLDDTNKLDTYADDACFVWLQNIPTENGVYDFPAGETFTDDRIEKWTQAKESLAKWIDAGNVQTQHDQDKNSEGNVTSVELRFTYETDPISDNYRITSLWNLNSEGIDYKISRIEVFKL